MTASLSPFRKALNAPHKTGAAEPQAEIRVSPQNQQRVLLGPSDFLLPLTPLGCVCLLCSRPLVTSLPSSKLSPQKRKGGGVSRARHYIGAPLTALQGARENW